MSIKALVLTVALAFVVPMTAHALKPVCNPGEPCNDPGEPPIDPPDGCTSNAECSDGDACNGRERCIAGNCILGIEPDCDDGDPCTADSCLPTRGCTHVFDPTAGPECLEIVVDPPPTTTLPPPGGGSPPTTTTTTTRPSTTTTTLVPVGDPCADAAACDDGDPCTADACSAAGCMHAPLAGGIALSCVCDRELSATCAEALPRALRRRLNRACGTADVAAAREGSSAARRLASAAARKFNGVLRLAGGLGESGKLDALCASEVRAMVQDAPARALALRARQTSR